MLHEFSHHLSFEDWLFEKETQKRQSTAWYSRPCGGTYAVAHETGFILLLLVSVSSAPFKEWGVSVCFGCPSADPS